MTGERGSHAESKNCEILLFPTADRHFGTKVKCPTGRASFLVKFPTVRSLTRVKCPGIARGGGWAVLELTGTLHSVLSSLYSVQTLFGAYFIIFGAFFVIFGAYFIIFGAYFIIFGAFFIIFGAFFDMIVTSLFSKRSV